MDAGRNLYRIPHPNASGCAYSGVHTSWIHVGSGPVEQIGIRRLRAEVAAQVRRAGAGERLVITVDGRPVAQLGPLEAPAGSHTIGDLAALGRILPARRGDRPPPDMSLPLWAGTRIDQLVRGVRGR